VSLDPAEQRRRAGALAYALGIALYLAPDGMISQHGPGERIEPPPNACPTPHGHGRGAAAAATP
jgi:hypothetical protein